MPSPIHIGLSPNLRLNDVLLALRLLSNPWGWKDGSGVKTLEHWFEDYSNVKHAVALNSGRAAGYLILKSLGIGKEDEVLVQAFTCVAVPNCVLWTRAKPVFVDIDKTYNMDPADLEKKITSHSRAIIFQHTFGISENIDRVLSIAKKHNLYVIEDCAHIIKKDIKGQAAFFSFGRDKAVSGVFGGMAVTNDDKLGPTIRNQQKSLEIPGSWWIFQQLFHPVATFLILPLYNFFGLGKALLWFLQKLKLLSFPIYKEEKEGGRPPVFPTRLANALAILVLNQLKDLKSLNEERIKISRLYKNSLKELFPGQSDLNGEPLLRYPVLLNKAEEFRNYCQAKGVVLGNWYTNVVDPKGVNLNKIGYQRGSCQQAEDIASKIVNLPTYPRMNSNDAYKVVNLLYDFHKRNK